MLSRNEQSKKLCQLDAGNELAQYIQFMRKDIRKKDVALPKSCRRQPISHLLDNYLSECTQCEFDPHKHHFAEVGGESQLVKAIRSKEPSILFKNEALLKTYPTSYLLSQYKKFCKKNLPFDLQQLTFGMLYGDGIDNEKVVDEVVLSDEDQKVSPQVRIALPTYANDIYSQKKWRDDVIQLAYAAGYYFSSQQQWDYHRNAQVQQDIRVFYITFEAKYTYMDVDLKGNLYHVTSLKSLPKIRKQGLIAKMQATDFSYPDRVFLFNDMPYETILAYGKDKAQHKGDKEFCVLKILKSRLINSILYKNRSMKFYRDPSFSDEDSTSTEQKAIFTYSNIPKDLIEDDVLVYSVDDGSTRVEKFKT